MPVFVVLVIVVMVVMPLIVVCTVGVMVVSGFVQFLRQVELAEAEDLREIDL